MWKMGGGNGGWVRWGNGGGGLFWRFCFGENCVFICLVHLDKARRVQVREPVRVLGGGGRRVGGGVLGWGVGVRG